MHSDGNKEEFGPDIVQAQPSTVPIHPLVEQVHVTDTDSQYNPSEGALTDLANVANTQYEADLIELKTDGGQGVDIGEAQVKQEVAKEVQQKQESSNQIQQKTFNALETEAHHYKSHESNNQLNEEYIATPQMNMYEKDHQETLYDKEHQPVSWGGEHIVNCPHCQRKVDVDVRYEAGIH